MLEVGLSSFSCTQKFEFIEVVDTGCLEDKGSKEVSFLGKRIY
jgi:hypothetical protein